MRAIEKTMITELVRVSVASSQSDVPIDISVSGGVFVYSL